MDSVDQAANRKRTSSIVVLGEAASSLPNRMLTLSADNSEMSKINTKIEPLRKKATNFYASNFAKPLR